MLIAPTVTYPGVYVVETPSDDHVVPAIPTARTAFVGRTLMGPVNEPRLVTSMGDFQKLFGGVSEMIPLTFQVQDFFNNGGAEALIVRVYGSETARAAIVANAGIAKTDPPVATMADPDEPAPKAPPKDPTTVTGQALVLIAKDNIPVKAATTRKWGDPTPGPKKAPAKPPFLQLDAANPGLWGNYVTVQLDQVGLTSAAASAAGVALQDLFNLTITVEIPGQSKIIERITKVSVDPKAGQFRLDRALANQSLYVRAALPLPKTTDMRPIIVAGAAASALQPQQLDASWPQMAGGSDGYALNDPYYYTNSDYQANRLGLYALELADIFNLLVVPRDQFGIAPSLYYPDIFAYVVAKRAFWILESPPDGSWDSAIVNGGDPSGLIDQAFQSPTDDGMRHAAVYYPDVTMPNPLLGGMSQSFGPAGVVAGIYAATDRARGVWKAPAGTMTKMGGVLGLAQVLNDSHNGQANIVGINCLMSKREGNVIWGARTLAGSDVLDDPFKYLSVRRLANYLEESIYRALQWAVFEPNHEPLWAAMRLQLTSFLSDLMLQGAFQGFTQKEAFFVKCDATTTSQEDIDKGICNVIVGYAPVKPAEFVVLYFQQITQTAQ